MLGWEMRIVWKAEGLRKSTLSATRKWLHRVGGYARNVAKNSLKLAKPKRNDDELTDYELDRWVIWAVQRERRGLEPPPYPDRISQPGRPPLIHDRNSPLKRLLVYDADAEAGDVVIGPERAKSGIAHKLEFGSGRILPRPFMRPAEEKTRPHMARWWADAIK